jgi:hypothetical protein
MPTPPAMPVDVAKAIQLALAPVFLLTGIAGLLSVMTSRLSRIIDRGRRLTEDRESVTWLDDDGIVRELRVLERRRYLTSLAITGCTMAALLVCTVIASIFFEALFDAHLRWVIGFLFTAATLALLFGLACFLREVHLATKFRFTIPGAR